MDCLPAVPTEILQAAPIKDILITDSVFYTEQELPSNLHYLSASELIGEATIRIHERRPVSPLFAYNRKGDEA